MTTEEGWSGRKPSVDHFKVFGCIVYAHIPDQKRTKLDDKGAKCIFLGVGEHSKAYKLFNPIIVKVITSRDVVFDEEKTWVCFFMFLPSHLVEKNEEVLGNEQQDPTTIYCDNVSAIRLSKNPVMHGRSKHIDVRYHFLRDLCKDGVIELQICKSEDQVADLMTKPLKRPVFEKLRSVLGVCSREGLAQE